MCPWGEGVRDGRMNENGPPSNGVRSSVRDVGGKLSVNDLVSATRVCQSQ